MAQKPLVSVIIPVYNAARFVRDSINSALLRDYDRKEVIVIDDGSTDETPTVLSSFGERITVITQRNAGAPAARNRGLEKARGDYVAFLDADDLWLPGKLETQVGYLDANPHVGMVYHAWKTWYPDSTGHYAAVECPLTAPLDAVEAGNSGFIYTALLLDCIVHTSTAMLRRSVIEQVGSFDPGLLNGEDYDYWLRVSRVTEIHKLAAVFSLYRIVPDSACRIPSRTNCEYEVLERALKRWGPTGPTGLRCSWPLLRKRKASLLLDFAYRLFHMGDKVTARNALLSSLRYRPFSSKAWLYLCLSLLPSRVVASARRILSDV